MSKRNRILVVDDEPMVRRTICRILDCEGMETVEAITPEAAIQLAATQAFDLILLDIMMEHIDGFQVLSQIRSKGIQVPVFIISGRQADNDKILALGLGADDYITKPFSATVLCAKVKAFLRRVTLSVPEGASVIHAGPFSYFIEEMRLTKDGVPIPLSGKEAALMRLFLNNTGKILTKEQIFEKVWGDSVVDDNTIMVHIRKLRLKIEQDANSPKFLKTVRGVGYTFSAS